MLRTQEGPVMSVIIMIYYYILFVGLFVATFVYIVYKQTRRKFITPKNTHVGKIWVVQDAVGNVVMTFRSKKEMVNYLKQTQKYYGSSSSRNK
jgi:hypothetical protein